MARARRLSPLDAAFLYFEKPHQRLHVGCVALLDGPIAVRRLRRRRWRSGWAASRATAQRPVRPLLDLDWPRWEDDPHFDVRRHLRHVAVPPPGGDARAARARRRRCSRPASIPRHPLWETYLIDGLADGRAALLCKVHHAMIDGVSGAQVLEAMADPVAPRRRPRSSPARPGARRLALRRASGPARSSGRARDALARRSASIALDARSSPCPSLPFNGPITDARRIVWTSFPLDDFLAMRGAAGCKVNDVVLAVIAGALRRYLEARGVPPDGVRRAHAGAGERPPRRRPPDARQPGDVDVPAAAGRRRRPGRAAARASPTEMRTLKEQGQPRATGLAMQLVGALPAPVNALLGRLAAGDSPPINTVCTNVPGPRDACHMLGRRILEVHPIVPLFQGIGLEFAIMSYAGQLSISAAVEPHLVPDARDIPGHLQAAAEELHAALGAAGAARPRGAGAGEPARRRPDDGRRGHHRPERVARHAPTALMRARPHPPPARRRRTTAGSSGLVTHRDLLAASSSSLTVPAEADRVRLLACARAGDVMETHVSVAAPRRRRRARRRAHDPPQDRLPARGRTPTAVSPASSPRRTSSAGRRRT